MTRLLAAATCMVAAAAMASASQEPGEPTLHRLPFRTTVLWLPLTPYNLQRTLAEMAWVARIPIGYESTDDEPWDPAPQVSARSTAGRTVKEVLDAIVAREPRYQWTVDEGVVHLRPRMAVDDPGSVPNGEIAGLTLEAVTLSDALREVHFTLRPDLRGGGIAGSVSGPTALGLRRFSVSVGTTTVQGVLDAIVKAHGASSWSVTYTADPGATRRYRISFHTFDGWGLTW